VFPPIAIHSIHLVLLFEQLLTSLTLRQKAGKALFERWLIHGSPTFIDRRLLSLNELHRSAHNLSLRTHFTMTSSLKSALPAHLKSALGNGDANAEFARKHHGKTQSHMAFENTSTSVA